MSAAVSTLRPRQPRELALVTKTLGEFMPLKLKAVLRAHGISSPRLAEATLQRNGRPMSDSAVLQLINHQRWPTLSDPAELRAQIERRLVDLGVPEAELAGIWTTDEAERSFGPTASMKASMAASAGSPAALENLAQATEVRVARAAAAAPARAAARDAARAARAAERAAVITTPYPEITLLEPAMLSDAARRHFQLFRDPFTDDVQSHQDVFSTPDIRYVREAMWTTAKLGGFLAVVGESGAGKTVLRRDLLDRIAREGAPIRVVQPRVFDKAHLTAAQICEAILDDMRPGVQVRLSLEARARQVEKVLTESSRGGLNHVLIIEEAHDLSVSTLKYLKRFWEMEDGFKKLLAIVLIGQPELKMRLDERINFEAREVIRRCEIAELRPLDMHLAEYLQHKLQRVGADVTKLIAQDAVDAMRTRLTVTRPSGAVSLLYPLVVNNLATRALNLAAEFGAPQVTADLIAEL